MGIPGRVGYQCSNFYRKLIEKNEVQDSNYALDEAGKVRYLKVKVSRRKTFLCILSLFLNWKSSFFFFNLHTLQCSLHFCLLGKRKTTNNGTYKFNDWSNNSWYCEFITTK